MVVSAEVESDHFMLEPEEVVIQEAQVNENS